jgi:hypothetical protein
LPAAIISDRRAHRDGISFIRPFEPAASLNCCVRRRENSPVWLGAHPPSASRGQHMCWLAHDRTTACRRREGSRSPRWATRRGTLHSRRPAAVTARHRQQHNAARRQQGAER